MLDADAESRNASEEKKVWGEQEGRRQYLKTTEEGFTAGSSCDFVTGSGQRQAAEAVCAPCCTLATCL
jgi:hypothetical protein